MRNDQIEVLPSQIICHGDWTLATAEKLTTQIQAMTLTTQQPYPVDADGITTLDTAGAFLLHELLQNIHQQTHVESSIKLSSQQQPLFDLVSSQNLVAAERPKAMRGVAVLGKEVVDRSLFFLHFLSFIGEISLRFCKNLWRPSRFPWSTMFATIESMGCYALPIIALLNFLVGVVLTYQMGLQLQNYGANIYIVDLLGLSILREFAPLITAIIVAGRTGAAFTAEIGTMIVNEEVDALKTMGIHPLNFLCLPKLMAMIGVLPLLTVWADLFGILGGMMMAKNMLHVSYTNFIDRFHDAIALSNYVVGLVKTPVFAIIITLVGCFQGLNVEKRADSVGRQTTKSVVQAIFLIIIVDALFSILFSWAKV